MSYFISQGLFVVFTGLIVSLGFNFSYGNAAGDSAPVYVLFLGTILFGLALMSLSMVLSTIFTDSKLSAQVGMFLLLLPTSIYLFCISQRLQAVALNKQSSGYIAF
jgi:ABC-type transport system involved in multi-copper enzyme maturation permease subunit